MDTNTMRSIKLFSVEESDSAYGKMHFGRSWILLSWLLATGARLGGASAPGSEKEVRVTTEAQAAAVVLEAIRKRGGDPKLEECSAKEVKGEWWVTAWHIRYPKNSGGSRFVPGGFTTYVVSREGTIERTIGGK